MIIYFIILHFLLILFINIINYFWFFLNFCTVCELLYLSWFFSEFLFNTITNQKIITKHSSPLTNLNLFFKQLLSNKRSFISSLLIALSIFFVSDFFIIFFLCLTPLSLFLCVLITLIFIALSVAAFTLLDRKIIAIIQRRRGPNVLGLWGLLQGIADAVKLIFKEIIYPSEAGLQLFIIAPIMTLSISLLGWCVVCLHPILCFSDLSFDILLILIISSFNVYSIVLAGWSSNSRYAFLGSLRAIAQVISYELPMIFCLLPVVAVCSALNFKTIIFSQINFFFFTPFFPCALIFLICIFAETNRSPFDLPEAESELVAGYNTEYSSVIFAFFFLAEYSNIFLMSVVWVSVFFGGWLPFFSFLSIIPSGVNFALKLCMVCFFFVVVRANLPRFRYDQFMNFGWKVLLPISFMFFIIYLSYLAFFYSLILKVFIFLF